MIVALERLAEFAEVRALLLGDGLVGFLREGAAAADARLRGLVAKLLLRLAQSEADVVQLVEARILGTCEGLMLDDETGTAEEASRVLQIVAQWPAGRAFLLGAGGDDGGLVQRLQERARSVPDTQRVRILHLFVELGKASNEVFVVLEQRGVYKEVLDTYFTDDILLKLVAIELMDALGSFSAGQVLLSSQGVPIKLAQELEDPMCDESARLCLTRLLGLILMRTPGALEVLLPSRSAPFAKTLEGMLRSRELADRLCAPPAYSPASFNFD